MTGSVLEPVIGERSGRLPVLDNALDVRDRWQGVMGDREATARSMAKKGARSYVVEQPGRPQEAEAEEAE